MNAAIESKKAKPELIYQGIGVICGCVTVDASEKYFIDIEGEKFGFQPTKSVRTRLTECLEQDPNTEVYLRVYPVYSYKHHQLWFTATKVYSNKPELAQINQFILAGIWQYIPQLPDQPVMSIYRNSLRGREKIESVRTNHLPVRGFVESAYRYQEINSSENPPKRRFYRLLVRLNPQQQTFEYLSLLESSENVPNYIRKKKKKTKKKRKPSQPDPIKKVKQMNFSLLQKNAIKLREAGFFEGKVSGKGITKETLRTKVEDSLSNHPEAVKVLSHK
ncbi:MAG: hypothetical protein QNJ72_41755 [Pleurocapsa sp. MO_226.B13]|nr:hypothetical protein [Pleurocapsa sp. MO_226.B13]